VKGACEDLREVFDSVVVRKKSKAHGVAAAFTHTPIAGTHLHVVGATHVRAASSSR